MCEKDGLIMLAAPVSVCKLASVWFFNFSFGNASLLCSHQLIVMEESNVFSYHCLHEYNLPFLYEL